MNARSEQVRQLLEVVKHELDTALQKEPLPTDAYEVPQVDLRSLLGEMTALKAEVRAETKAIRELRDVILQDTTSREVEHQAVASRESALREELTQNKKAEQRRHALMLIDLADRIEPALTQARKLAQPRWIWFRKRSERAASALVEGVELTLLKIKKQLGDCDVTRVSTVGHPFDPMTMQAIGTVERLDMAEGLVIEEVTAGYQMARSPQPLRIAEVVVNKAAIAQLPEKGNEKR